MSFRRCPINMIQEFFCEWDWRKERQITFYDINSLDSKKNPNDAAIESQTNRSRHVKNTTDTVEGNIYVKFSS